MSADSAGTLCRGCDNTFDWIGRGRPRVYCGPQCSRRIAKRIETLRKQHARWEPLWTIYRDEASRAALCDIEFELRRYGAMARYVIDPETIYPPFPPASPLLGPGLEAYFRSHKRTPM